MKYLNGDALAVYGPIINISTFVQCCAYSVGQAAQPIISTNYGAGKRDRINETLKYSLYTVAAFALFWTTLSCVAPNLYIRIFMKPTDKILEIAPSIIRAYSISFLLLPLNIFSTYYFQSIMKPKAAFIVSVARGLVVSGALIMLLPLIKPSAIWFAMPITEFIVAIYSNYDAALFPNVVKIKDFSTKHTRMCRARNLSLFLLNIFLTLSLLNLSLFSTLSFGSVLFYGISIVCLILYVVFNEKTNYGSSKVFKFDKFVLICIPVLLLLGLIHLTDVFYLRTAIGLLLSVVSLETMANDKKSSV